MTAEEFADRATDILWGSLSKLPPDERERRIQAFEEKTGELLSKVEKEV